MSKQEKKMRVLFVCQGAALRIYHKAVQQLRKLNQIEAASFAVADYSFYRKYVAREGPVEINGEVLCQWEIAQRGISRHPSPEEIARWEERLDVPSLWPTLVCDRRTYMGRLCKVRQDYKPYLSLQQLQGIAVESVETFWHAFGRLKPDFVVGFAPATFEAIIIYWIARARGVPYLHLKSTKIGNYVTFSADIREGHPHIKKRYKSYLQEVGRPLDSFLKAAREYVDHTARGRVTYEGVLVKSARDLTISALLRFIFFAPYTLMADVRAKFEKRGFDTQRQPAFRTLWQQQVARSFSARAARRIMRPAVLDLESLSETPYVFYPLNTEPEVALSVYGRYLMNQIEVARNVAQSLPLGTLLVIKEHPRSLGMRTASYYRKLREIPNASFAPVEMPSAQVVRHAKAVIVISGFVGFEAVLQRKPVIVLGHCPYSMLPETMVRRVRSFEDLPSAMRDMMRHYEWNEHALLSYVAAVMRESVPVDLWSTLLAKKGRVRGTGAAGQGRSESEQYHDLAEYLLRRIEQESNCKKSVSRIPY